MEYTLLRIPVVCPECGAELLAELPAASIAQALGSGIEAMRRPAVPPTTKS